MIKSLNDLVGTIDAFREAFQPPTQWFDPVTLILASMLGMYSLLLAIDHPSIAVVACAFSAGAFTAYMPRQQAINGNAYMDMKPKRKVEAQSRSKTGAPTELQLSDTTLCEKTNRLVDLALRDFVSTWWSPMNFYSNKEFEDEVRITMNVTLENFERAILAHDSNDLIMAMVYGVANSLIIHMREYREFEDSHLDLHEFTRRNPSSPFSQLLSNEEQHQQLRELGYSFIQKMVPKEDLTSPIVAAFFKEVFASYALESVLGLVCDPDYLNLCIVDALNDATEENDVHSAEHGLSQLEGFRSVVEKAAEDAMATKNEGAIQSTAVDSAKSELVVSDLQHVAPGVYNESTAKMVTPKDDERLEIRTSSSSSSTTLNGQSPSIGIYPGDIPRPSNDEQQMNSGRFSLDSSRSSLKSITTSQQNTSGSVEQMPAHKSLPPMLFERGTVSFSIMDISPNDTGDKIDVSSLLFFVQIERSANTDKRQSEGGGYILTRTYDNFAALQSVLSARHPKVVSKLSLKLPLDQGRSWRNNRAQQNNRENICRSLEKYLHTVADDDALGRDKSFQVFLRKEQNSSEDIDSVKSLDVEIPPEEGSIVSKARNYFSGTATPLSNEEDTSHQQMSPRTQYSRWINKRAQREKSLKDLADNEQRASARQSTDSLRPTKVSALDATLMIKPDGQSNDKQPSDVKSHQDQPTNTHKKLNSIEVELLIETTFALITEIFQLTEANQSAWLRRTALNLLREVIRRSYAEVISQQFVKYMHEYGSTAYFTTLITTVTDKFWPNGEWATAAPVRTPEEKAVTKSLARELLKARGVPSGARQLIGELNCVDAMERLWSRCQNVNLNRVLGVQLLERTLRPLVN